MALLLTVLAVMNTYPIITAQNMVFQSERTILINQANVISSSLSVMNSLTEEGVRMVMDLMGNREWSQVLVTDANRSVIYNSLEEEGEAAVFSDEIETALEGKDVFHSSFNGNEFVSSAAVPVTSGQAVIGCVYIYDLEVQQGNIIVNIQNNLMIVSVLVSFLAIGLSITFSSNFARRANSILRSIILARKGDYNQKLSIKGNDEFAQLADEFNSLTSRLRQTEEERRRFVADASHELKTPLASIKLLADSIITTRDMDEETLLEFMGDIGSQADRLSRLSEKLLTLSRLDEQGETGGTAVNCSQVTNVVVRDLRFLASADGITIVDDVSPNCMVYGNEDELYQIVYNLVENAIKYNTENGSVFVTVRSEGSGVTLVVKDTGKGIPQEDIGKIFNRFYRVDKARSREKGGSGIGLSIVSEGIKRYGGTINVHSNPGGTTFTVNFLPPSRSS